MNVYWYSYFYTGSSVNYHLPHQDYYECYQALAHRRKQDREQTCLAIFIYLSVNTGA